MNELHLELLRPEWRHRGHVFAPMALEDWLAAGKPCVWMLAEVSSTLGLYVYLDSSYGNIAAVYADKGYVGSKMLLLPNSIVVLDMYYYGVSQYIWVPGISERMHHE